MPIPMPELPDNIATTYPDRSSGDATHQQHHDAIHAALKAVQADGGAVGAGEVAATYARVDKSAINVLQAGASPTKTPTENTTILNNVLTQAATEGRAVYFPATDTPIQINDALTVAGPGLTVYGDGPGTVAVQQTAWPKPFLDAGNHGDIAVSGIKAINTAPRVSDMTSFRNNTAKNYSAFLYANSGGAAATSGVTVLNCASDGFNAGIFCLGTAALRNSAFRVDGFEFRDGEFGVFADYTDGVQIRNVWGDYSYSDGGSQAPHLLYIGGFPDSNITDVAVENLRAFNSPASYAFQVKSLVGGVVRNLYADGCGGVLAMMALSDTLVDGVVSLNDVYPAAADEGSLCTVSLDPMTRVTIRNVNIELVNDARGIRLLSGTGCKLEDATVRVAHTTTSNTTYDIEVRDEWLVDRPRVINAGTNAWDCIYVFTGTGATIRDPEVSGHRIGVRVSGSATDARIYYDRDRFTAHTTDGLHPVDLNIVANNNKAIPLPSSRTQHGPRNLGASMFDVASGSAAAAGVIETGQLLEQAAGSWYVEDGYARNTTATVGVLWADYGQADVEIFTDILYRDANGIAFRGLDVDNYLFARIRQATLGVELRKREAGVETAIGTPYDIAPVNGRRYRLGVRTFGDEVKVLLDGVVVISHTLSAADMTAFGSNTLHGYRSHTDTAAKFTDLVVNSLH